jgi:hypothetical protein
MDTWVKWGLGLLVVAGGAVSGYELLVKPGAQAPAFRVRPTPVAVEYSVQEEDDGWVVMQMLYAGVDAFGDAFNGYGGDMQVFPTRKEATAYARGRAKEDRDSGDFQLVRVLATDKEWAAADKRRQARKAREMDFA